MKFLLGFWVLGLSFVASANAEDCPSPSATQRYVRAPLRLEEPQSDSIQIYYELASEFDPKNPTLLVLNGGPGGDHHILDSFRSSPVAERVNLVAFDHRGIGCTKFLSGSDARYEPGLYSMKRMADDLEAIRQELLGPEGKWFVYGVSFGGMLAQQYTIRYPERVLGQILDSTFHDVSAIDISRKQFMDLFVRDQPQVGQNFDRIQAKFPELITQLLRVTHPLSYSYIGRTEEIPRLYREVAEISDLKKAESRIGSGPSTFRPPLNGVLRSIFCEELWDYPGDVEESSFYWWFFHVECNSYFEKIRQPMQFGEALRQLPTRTFIWAGRYDPVTPVQAMEEMDRLLPNSLLWVNPHAGHGLLEEKEECAEELLSLFLRGAGDTEILAKSNSEACQSAPKWGPGNPVRSWPDRTGSPLNPF